MKGGARRRKRTMRSWKSGNTPVPARAKARHTPHLVLCTKYRVIAGIFSSKRKIGNPHALRQTQHPTDPRRSAEHGCEPPLILRAIVARSLPQRDSSGEERNQALGRQRCRSRRARETPSPTKGSTKAGGVARHQNIVSLRARFAKDKGRGCYWIAERLPSATPFLQRGMASKYFR